MNEIVKFYGPDEENGYLGNWYKADFLLDGRVFSCVEQYMMFKKAVIFGDEKMADKILREKSPLKMRAYGRKIENFEDVVWNGWRQSVVIDGLYAKFSQNEALCEQLLATGNSIIAECSPTDRVWGIGLCKNDNRSDNMSQWQGTNLLGFSLMIVREKLRSKNA